jgi:hypothetical protein
MLRAERARPTGEQAPAEQARPARTRPHRTARGTTRRWRRSLRSPPRGRCR